MVDKSRAEYFRKRREKFKQFVVMVDKEQVAALDEKLQERGITRTEWLRQKIREEIGQ